MNQEDKIVMDKYATGEIVAVDTQPVKLAGNPEERLKQGKEAAKALMSVAKPVNIQGNQHLPIGDWQTIGSFYGLSAGAEDSEPVVIDNVSGFKAKAVVRKSDGTIISSAIGYCMDEGTWKGREMFAQASMAQTRACSKALRMVLGWVVVLAGYKDTPAEEMDFQDQGVAGGETIKARTEKVIVTHNPPETVDGLECPQCKGGMVDNRDIDGGAKLSGKGKKLVSEGKPLEGAGLKLPLYKCSDDNCKGVIWENTKPIAEEEIPF